MSRSLYSPLNNYGKQVSIILETKIKIWKINFLKKILSFFTRKDILQNILTSDVIAIFKSDRFSLSYLKRDDYSISDFI